VTTPYPERALTAAMFRAVPYVLGPLLVVVGLFALTRMIVLNPVWPRGTDLGVFLNAADAILHGNSPYDIDFQNDLNGYAYPPLFAEFIAALTLLLGYGKLWIIWSGFCLICLISSLVLMLRWFGPKIDCHWMLLLIGTAMTSRMVRGDAYDGAINILLLLLLLVGLKKFLSNNVIAGSVTWAVMIVFKPFMGILVFYLIRRRCWKCAIITVAIAGALFAGSFLPFLPNLAKAFAGWLETSHAHTSLPFIAKPGNQSFYGVLMRSFTASQFSDPWMQAPKIIGFLMIPIVGVALATFLFAVSNESAIGPSSKLDGPRALLEVGIVMALSLSCGPLLEGDYEFVILPGLFGAVMLVLIRPERIVRRRTMWLSIVAWCLGLASVGLPITVKFLEPYTWSLPVSGLAIFGTGRVCVSLFIASILSAAALWHDRDVAQKSHLI
jgi:hypothetical protein